MSVGVTKGKIEKEKKEKRESLLNNMMGVLLVLTCGSSPIKFGT
jgi:hypothetical protein